jgi:hypothetical protein
MRNFIFAAILALQTVDPTTILDRIAADLELLRASLVKNEVVVHTSVELQDALDGSVENVKVMPGLYIGNFTVKAKTTKTVVLGLTFDGRATATNVYPKLVAANTILSVLSVMPGAHDVTFRGLEFTGVAFDRNVIEVGAGTKTMEMFPKNITFDQDYIHGVGDIGHRGIYFDAINGVATRSRFTGFVELGRDSQGIGVYQGPGPYFFDDNYTEASGEGMMVGGSDPVIPGLIPSDITVSNSTFFKPQEWKTKYPSSVKNQFELKNARRVKIFNNVFDGVWADAQSGSGIVFTVRNQDGGCPWCNITDVEFKCNVIRHVTNYGMNILGTDNNHPSGTMENVLVENNWFDAPYSGIMVNGGKNITFNLNTFSGLGGAFLALTNNPTMGLRFTNNTTPSAQYGLFGDAVGAGVVALTKYAPDAVFVGNTIASSSDRFIQYPAGNTIVPTGSLTAPTGWTCK